MPSPFMPMYNPLFTPWMATTLRPTGIRLNRAEKGARVAVKNKQGQRHDSSQGAQDKTFDF